MRHDKTHRPGKTLMFLTAGFLGLAIWISGRSARGETPMAGSAYGTAIRGSLSESVFDAAYRIDIQTILVTFTYHPAESYVDGECRLYFKMRPGQRRPLFHFDPLSRGELKTYVLKLDDEEWRVPATPQQSVIDIVEFPGSTQKACEIRRDIDDQKEHVMQLSYRLNRPTAYPRFSSEVNDYHGDGNEEIFPTINSPQELARHVITLRVAGTTARYRCIGSGLVTLANKSDGVDVGEWILDTEREMASYTVMFALLPESDTLYEERTISGIPVRIMAFKGGASISEAFNKLTPWLPELSARLGPFPMPRGLSVFLVTGGGGMEYFGATISTLEVLTHEVFHMYFGCSTVANTYRDSWWDEAITSWYLSSAASSITPMWDSYRSNMVSGRSPIAVGFDLRAYNQGSQIIEAMAQKAGGRDALIRFLRAIHQNYSFAPFDSLRLCEYFKNYCGADMRTQFVNWLYSGQAPSSGQEAGSRAFTKNIDWTPPQTILRKYGVISR